MLQSLNRQTLGQCSAIASSLAVQGHISGRQTHDENRIICSIPLKYNSEFSARIVSTATNHKHRIRNLVFAHPSTEDDHAGLLGVQRNIIEPSNVLDDVNNEPRIPEGVEVDHVTQGAIRQGRAKDGNVIL